MTKSEIAAALREAADLLEFHGENQFKVKAFNNAARSFLGDAAPLEDLLQPGRLEKVKGIGKATAELIRELATTGESAMITRLREGTPAGLAELMRVPKLGVKKIAQLYMDLGINSLDELEAACRDGRITECRGFTKASAPKLLEAIEQARRYSGQLTLAQALVIAAPVLEELRRCPAVIRAEVAGSLRRCKEVVGDLDFVASSDDSKAVMDCFAGLSWATSVVARGDTKTTIMLPDDVQADLRVVSDDNFATALHHFTGSKEHNTQLRSRALKLGYKVNEYGVYPTDKPTAPGLTIKTEDDLFAALKLQPIAPELREGEGEIEAAAAKKLPKLIERDDYRGVLHCHTDWSDGKNTISEMAVAARDQYGWEYFAVCDHSELAAYAGGIKKAEVAEQHAEIDEANEALATKNFQILKGCECDILRDGDMDYPNEILATMDVVVASVHSRYKQTGAEMTARIIGAMENPYVHIIGHVSGRLLLMREPYEFDIEAVLEAAARTRTVMEINADPRRLDIDWRYCRRAKEMGVKFSINPDAHSISNYNYVDYGISMARKGWLEPGDVINCMGLKDFLKWAKATREWKLKNV
jgi:DNA polymerase (family 10)